MKKVLVRYKVKESKVAENELLVKAVYDQLNQNQIQGFHYCTFKLQDGVSFIHVAFSDTEKANTEFSQLSAFKKFQSEIKERCEDLPVVSQVSIVGSYEFKFDLLKLIQSNN
jgi:hypothetical protein